MRTEIRENDKKVQGIYVSKTQGVVCFHMRLCVGGSKPKFECNLTLGKSQKVIKKCKQTPTYYGISKFPTGFEQ